jgi:hypothetical protein
MFKLAVLGPIVTGSLGVARQCVDCYRWRPSYGGAPCFGFGPGCINYRPGGSRQSTDQEKDSAILPGEYSGNH